MRFSIRSRFLVLLLLLTILPFLAYRFAIDLHKIMLNNQAIVQKQTVQNLALILENRTDLWALQIQKGKPTHLNHLNLDNSVLWVVNEFGQTTYVVGRFDPMRDHMNDGFFVTTGKLLIKTLATFIPYSLPYPYPQSSMPEKRLISSALNGNTIQQYRMNKLDEPVSLMSGTPLSIHNRIIGSLILEQPMETLFSESLNYFYRLIGIGAIIFFLVIIGAILHTAALSNRIIRLDNDVKKTFNAQGRLTNLVFPDKRKRIYEDELSDLRHHIHEMLEKLGAYERYLKQLPKTLRHELHNPLNRLSMSLTLMENDKIEHPQLQYANHALKQLRQIISALSEANSIEDSLQSQTPESFPISVMLNHYFENMIALNPEHHFSFKNEVNEALEIKGDGFMMEQLFDKLISNAMDFDDQKIPISISASETDNDLTISIRNSGELLPEGYEKQIFEGMTSIRTLNQDQQAHLGLGLYIVKLITDFHQGRIEARNFFDGNDIQGVEFILTLPKP